MSVHHEAAVHAGAWPVMYADFGEARKPMTFATSSGVSMRPSGTLLRRALVNSAGLTNGHDRVTPTEAPSKERFPVLKKALAPDSRERRQLGLKTCNIALETPFYSELACRASRAARGGHDQYGGEHMVRPRSADAAVLSYRRASRRTSPRGGAQRRGARIGRHAPLGRPLARPYPGRVPPPLRLTARRPSGGRPRGATAGARRPGRGRGP